MVRSTGSSVFFHSEEQEKAARAMNEKLQQQRFGRKKIVTEITPASKFWKAEEYHQKYYAKCGLTKMHF